MGLIEHRDRKIEEIKEKLEGDLTPEEIEELEEQKDRLEAMNRDARTLRDNLEVL
jgi:hypothetical protein